ncbi:MAG TPA: M48 family metalloprotease [Streptosporangiaceae bacterium]|nr:M48 family metalloprotease [Streptosporangiaceae bacterium]
MTTESPRPAGEAGGEAAADRAAATRGNVFALPASTSFRFALLIAAVVISSGVVYEAIYLATPRGPALAALIHGCAARALASHPHGLIAYAGALGQARACRAGAERVVGWWVLLGIGVLAVLAGALYWIQPWWYRRRMHLAPLTSQDAPAVVERLEELRQLAGAGPVAWLLEPLDLRLSAFAFGHFRRRFVAVSGGAVVTAARQPADFDAVVLHELSHIRNRDIDQAYLAVAIWRAFVVTALLPIAGLLIFRQLGSRQPELLWRVAVLALLVYLLRNSILRAREFDADARVAELDPGTSLGAVLAGLPRRRGWRGWHLGWVHPSGQNRAAALLDPAPLYRCGFWDGLAVGLVAAIGAEAGQNLVYLLLTASAAGGLLPAFVFALFSGVALAVAVWRMRFWEGGMVTARVWAVGLGLGLGVAAGPLIALDTAFGQQVAPDSLHTGAYIVLAIWVVLVTFLFVSVPAWIGRWADAWQQRQGRVPARGGMIAAAIGTWVVLAIGIDLVLAQFTSVTTFDAANKIALEDYWTFDGNYAAQQLGARVVCLVFIAVPLAGYIAGLRQRPAGSVRRAALTTRMWLKRAGPVALICLAGVVMVIAVVLVTAAVARVRIAPAIRWNGFYFSNFFLFEPQMVILVAVLVALIAAATLPHALSDTIAIMVAAAVAALGILAMMGSQALGNCVALFNLTYDHQPASNCPGAGDPGSLVSGIFPAAIEAALISILLIPAAYYVRILIARRAGLGGRPGLAARAVRWLAVGAVAAAVIVGISLRVPDASAHGIQPAGSIGQDGWVYGSGYEFRLFPTWYEVPANLPPGDKAFEDDETTSGYSGYLNLTLKAVSPGTVVRVEGSRPFSLGGERARILQYYDKYNFFHEQLYSVRNYTEYIIGFGVERSDLSYLMHDINQMVNTWRWNATPSVSPASPSTASTSPAAAPSFTRIASTAQLTRALLPAQELGPGATVRNSGTDLADVVALCGDPLPGGARLTAYETLQDGQTGQFLEEFIIEWDNPGDAAVLIRNDHAALDKTGSCSYGSGEQRLEFAGDEPGSVPQECGNGQYVATQVSYPSVPLPGFHASAQCGLYTISVTIFGRAGPAVNHETADGYLNSAVGRLQKNLG